MLNLVSGLSRTTVFSVGIIFVSTSAGAELTSEELKILGSLKLSTTIESKRDPTNRFDGNAVAILAGQELFFDKEISGNKKISCASCHLPDAYFRDVRFPSVGIGGELKRKTPSLQGIARNSWFFHDGRADTLWSQSLEVLENPMEMGGVRSDIANYVRSNQKYANFFKLATGKVVSGTSDVAIFVFVGKALSAFVSTLQFPQTRFDKAIIVINEEWMVLPNSFSREEIEGAKIFVGRGQCIMCHRGSALSDGKFHNLGLPPNLGFGVIDSGRYGALQMLRKREFSASSIYSDAPEWGEAKLNAAVSNVDQWGAFRTPSLRNIQSASSFMHDGRFHTLREVIKFYSTLEGQEVGHHTSGVLQPLYLTDEEINALTAFLLLFSKDGN